MFEHLVCIEIPLPCVHNLVGNLCSCIIITHDIIDMTMTVTFAILRIFLSCATLVHLSVDQNSQPYRSRLVRVVCTKGLRSCNGYCCVGLKARTGMYADFEKGHFDE